MTPALPPFPFLIGCGRSGTTLARALLDAHPALAVPGESYFPIWLGRQIRRYQRQGTFDARILAGDLVGDPWFRRWQLPDDEVRAVLSEPGITTFADALRRVYALYARHHGKARYGDKTPTFVLHVEALARLFPEAVFVHIVRDGRDVALSLLEADWGPDRLDRAALHWRHHVERGRQAAGRIEPGRYREVRYEDLLDDPEGTARSLCDYLALPFDAAMLDYAERAPALLRLLPDADEHQNLRLPPTKGLRDWRREMEPADVATFEALAGDALAALGYERRTPVPVTGAARLVAVRAGLEWHLRQGARRLRTTAGRILGR
ncbi:MAG TPA: sulfotransferase [Acidimicrobiales bacterium]|nr:sulfotransferase [Acidimicrobiales bacterium]